MNSLLQKRMADNRFKFLSIDLFSGPGGLCTGFKWAGILPIIAVEWTDSTVLTYSHSHDAEVFELKQYLENPDYLLEFCNPSSKTLLIHGDINLVTNELILQILLQRFGINSIQETIDVISGGAPCESFSLAGTRTAGDTRDDLFSNIVRIARTTKAKMIMFENVKGLFSKKRDGIKGAIFNYICDTFEDKKFEPSYRLASRNPDQILMKACNFGVPQLRERLFLIGIRNDLTNLHFSYPLPTNGNSCAEPFITAFDAISDLPKTEPHKETTTYSKPSKYTNKAQEKFLSIMRGEYLDECMNAKVPEHLLKNGKFSSTSLSSHWGPGHIKRKQELLNLIAPRESMKSMFDKLTASGEIKKYRNLFPNTIYASRNRRLIPELPSPTITSHCLDEVLHYKFNRAVTPREAARLQSFPDWYQFEGPYVAFHGDKEQDRYEQIGDAIPPLLAFAMALQIIKCLNS